MSDGRNKGMSFDVLKFLYQVENSKTNPFQGRF